MVLLLIYTCWILFSSHPCFMWHFLHSYLSLLCRWTCQREEDWTLGLAAEGTSQYIKSGSPAALPNALARLSPQSSSKLFTIIQKRLFIYHNYYQECIDKPNYEMKKLLDCIFLPKSRLLLAQTLVFSHHAGQFASSLEEKGNSGPFGM